jgi:hypothetical protein
MRPGRDALGTGSTEEGLRARFPDRLHVLTQLGAARYVEVVALSLEETGPPSSDLRVCQVTNNGEKELNTSWLE